MYSTCLTQLNLVASTWLLRNWSRPWLNCTYWLQVVAALDKAPLTVSDATKRGLLTGAKYRSEACQNIRHDRQTRSLRRISYVLPSPGSAAESSDMTDSHGSSPCAQASSTLSPISQGAAMQPCSQQGPDLGVGGVSQRVLAAAIPWAPVAAAAGLIELCAQAVKDSIANKTQLKAVQQGDSIEGFQKMVKVEQARPVPPGIAYITSRFGDFHMQRTACHVISMQTYIEAMEREKQHAREKAGLGDIRKQPMVAVTTAAGKMLFCAPCPLSLRVLDCSHAVKALQHQVLCSVVACRDAFD